MIEENHEKPQSGWSAPGFVPGTSRMRVSCVTTEPPRSVLLLLLLLLLLLTFLEDFRKNFGLPRDLRDYIILTVLKKSSQILHHHIYNVN